MSWFMGLNSSICLQLSQRRADSYQGAGYDQVDVHACKARGIRVSNVPSIPDDATADVNMFLILGALRGFNTSMLALRAGQWRGNPPPPLGHDPEGKVLGILGMGGIGRNLKKKAEVFGMSVIYHNRRKLSDEQSGGAEYVSFDELLARSDVLSLNLPLNVSLNSLSLASPHPLHSPNSPSSRCPFLLDRPPPFSLFCRSLASWAFSLACRFRLSHQNALVPASVIWRRISETSPFLPGPPPFP